MKKIIIVGSLNMDLCVHAPYCPEKGETLTGNGFFINCGGKGANQAVAASRSGANVYMCGKIGEDTFGDTILQNLQNSGVNTNFISKVEKVSSGVAVILLTQGDNRIVLDKGANAMLSQKDIDRVLQVAEPGDIYLTQLENPIEAVGYGLSRAKQLGLFTILNPAPADNEIKKFLKYVDIITPNESEIEILGGKEQLFAAGVGCIITTLGGNGYEIASNTESNKYPCYKVKVTDTTAAGDTVCGALAAELAKGKNLKQAMEYASLAATIACTRKGAISSIPYREEVEKYLLK